MKQVKTIFMILIMILMCCSNSIGQSSSGIGIQGNVGAAPIGVINSGAKVYPIGEHGAGISLPLGKFVCNSMSACGMYDLAWVRSGAIVNIGGAGRVAGGAAVRQRMQSQKSQNTSP